MEIESTLSCLADSLLTLSMVANEVRRIRLAGVLPPLQTRPPGLPPVQDPRIELGEGSV